MTWCLSVVFTEATDVAEPFREATGGIQTPTAQARVRYLYDQWTARELGHGELRLVWNSHEHTQVDIFATSPDGVLASIQMMLLQRRPTSFAAMLLRQVP